MKIGYRFHLNSILQYFVDDLADSFLDKQARWHRERGRAQRESGMEEAKGVVKHVLLAKFKDSTPPDQIEELIKGYANLVNLVPPMKAFHWGKDVSIENMHQGFTHVFESTFESVEGIAEYVSHPAHVEFANLFLPHLEKVIVFDYKPITIHL